MSFKQEKVIVIISEFVNDKREFYPITNVPVEKARFFYKDDDGLFKVMASSDYAVRTELNETRLYITNVEIKEKSTKFQVGYEINFTSSEYETSLPVLSVLVEMYNNLIEDSRTIFNYVKKQCFISDDKTTSLVLPNLPAYTVWCMGENGEMFALPVSELYSKFGEMLNKLKSILADYTESKKEEIRGATFFPHLMEDGTLSWTNDKNKPNPEPVNIKGPAGTIENVTASVDSNAGTPSVKVTMSGTKENRSFNLKFQNLKGDPAIKGVDYYTPEEKQQFTTEMVGIVKSEGDIVIQNVKNIIGQNPASGNALSLGGKTRPELEYDINNIYGGQIISSLFPVKTNDLTERFKDNYYLEVTGGTLTEVLNDSLGLSSAKSSDISNCQEVIIAGVWGTVNNILGFVNDKDKYIKETQSQPFYNFKILDKEKKIIKVKVPKGAKYLYYNIYTKDKASAYCNGISYTGTKKLEWLELDANGFKDESINPLKLSSDLLYDKKMSYEFITGGYPIQDGYTINTSPHSNIGTVKLINVKYNEKYKIKFEFEVQKTNYHNYFIFGKQDNIASISSTEISNYVNIIDNINHIYEITIPKNCNFFLSSKRSEQLLEISKIETKKELNWLLLKSENFVDNTIPESAIIKKIVKEKTKYKYTDSLNKPFEFKGKTCVAFGDSITSGISSPNLKVTTPYIKLFADKVGLTIDNRAVSGTCITGNTEEYSIQNRILSYKTQKDFIFIAGGTNDFNSSKELGKYGDSQPTTFYGSLKIICEYITTTFPSSTVIFITPIPYTSASRFHDVPNELGYELNDYRNAIYEMATLYKFNVVDGTKLGMPEEKGDWSNAMCDDTDGCHPSVVGHELYFRNLAGKLC